MSSGTSDQPESFPAHVLRLARETVPPMHPAGRPFVLACVGLTLLARRIARPLGLLGAVLTGWCAWFFREPRRAAPLLPRMVAAPADGTVAVVDTAVPPAELGLGNVAMPRVSVFLSIFDVHVQRAPVDGVVAKRAYRPGTFLSADLDKASEDNERNALLLHSADGDPVVVVQIAGLLARRIVCDVAEGDALLTGQTYGMIRFGSRVDTYLPRGSRVLVRAGQRTVGGETLLAELAGTGR